MCNSHTWDDPVTFGVPDVIKTTVVRKAPKRKTAVKKKAAKKSKRKA